MSEEFHLQRISIYLGHYFDNPDLIDIDKVYELSKKKLKARVKFLRTQLQEFLDDNPQVELTPNFWDEEWYMGTIGEEAWVYYCLPIATCIPLTDWQLNDYILPLDKQYDKAIVKYLIEHSLVSVKK